VLVANKVLSIW